MRRVTVTRRLLAGAGALGMLALLGTVPAAAAGTPALLTLQDLPAGFQASGTPTTTSTSNDLVVDAKTCTETVVPIAGLSSAITATFVGSGPSSGQAIQQFVLSFPSARSAKTAFTARTKSIANGAKCGKVGFVPPGSSIPSTTVSLALVKVPKIAQGSTALSTAPAGAPGPTVAVSFLRTSYIVVINAPSSASPFTTSALTAIAKAADKHLR